MNNLLITGASSGIGKSVFETISTDRYDHIILIDKNDLDTNLNNVEFFKCDITKDDDVAKIFDNLKSKNIFITHAVNCAGVPGPSKSFKDSTIEEFDRVISVNLRATFVMLKKQIEHMTSVKKGKIINVASVLGSCGLAGSSYYGASKAGIIALTKHLAIEYASRNIQINCISPGGVDTNLISDLKGSIGVEGLENIHPVKRIASPNEVANYIKFLIEDASSFVTGSEIFIDGGYSAQ